MGDFDYGHVQARIAASHARKDTSPLRYERRSWVRSRNREFAGHPRTARDRLVHDEAAVRASNTAADLARYGMKTVPATSQVLDAERTLLESRTAWRAAVPGRYQPDFGL